MTHVLTIDGVGGSVTDHSLAPINKSDLYVISANVYDPKDNSYKTTYGLPGVDRNHPVRVEVRVEVPNKAQPGNQRLSIALRTWSRDVDDTGELADIVKPAVFLLSANVSDMDMELADMRTAFANLFSLTYVALNTKVPDTAVIGAMLNSATDVF